jgi:hypothetical protein
VRSRPDLKLFLSPGHPTPGTRFRAEAVLTSRSETPINGVEFHFLGREQRHAGTSMAGDVPIAQYVGYTHVDLWARTPKTVLSKGVHRFAADFDVPPGAAPMYRSQSASVQYDLQVRVEIPWWPDRSERYAVPIAALPERPRISAGTFCTDGRGPQGSALYLEASLESSVVPLGGSLRGAVSVGNVAQHRVRRINLSLVVSERGRGTSSAPYEVTRYTVTLVDGAPQESLPLRFRLGVPPDAAPGFTGHVVQVSWHLEVRAVITLGTDVTLTIPIEVIRAAEGAEPLPGPAARVPPVGRERRALVWAESARRHGLSNDPAEERMTMDLGENSSLAITLEPQKEGGLRYTATIAWPRLGIDLAVTEKRWVDAWSKGSISAFAPDFAARFTVRGREEAQVRAFLDEASCRALLLFDEVAAGEEGSVLASPGTAQSVEEVDAFVSRAIVVARTLSERTRRIPPPAIMMGYVEAWRSFAGMLGGRLEPGGMWIHEAAFDEATLQLGTVWSENGLPEATVVVLPLVVKEGGEDPRVDGPAKALLDGVIAQGASVEVKREKIVARLPAPLKDPREIEPVLVGLARLARMLRGGAAQGPYR